MSILALAACAQPGVGAQVPPSLPVDDLTTPVPIAAATMASVDAIDVRAETATPAVEQIIPITSTATVTAASSPPTSTPIARASVSVPSATIAPVLAPMPTPTVRPVAPTQPVPTPQPVATATPAPTPIATATLGPATPTPIAPLPRTAQFVPLDNPAFLAAAAAPASVTDESFVLGLDWNGEARAYPLDMMWWHHIVNDTIGGDPVLVTY